MIPRVRHIIHHPLFALLGIMLGLGLCGALIYVLDLSAQSMAQMFMHDGWPVVVFAPLLLTVFLMITGAWKWQILVHAFDEGREGAQKKQGFSFYLRHYLWHNWVGLFIPPSLAIIAGRGVSHHQKAGFKSGALNGIVDQATEFLFIAILIPVGLLYLLDAISVTALIVYTF